MEGDLSYIGDWQVKGARCSVYCAANPNREKGHKDYVLLYKKGYTLYVSGIDKKEMAGECTQPAVHCLNCDDVIWSVHRHDFHYCSCESVFIDGGKDYLRCGFNEGSKCDSGVLNHLTRTFEIGGDNV